MRGQRIIETPQGEIEIKFTNFGLAQAEQRLGKGILGIARDFANGQGSITDVGILLQAGISTATGKRVALTEAYKVIDDVGFPVVMLAVMEILNEVLTYKPEDNEPDPNS